MITTDEDALICDFAETYGVFDYRRLPVRTAATLAAGLRDNSRIKMKMAGMNTTPERVLEAAVADRLGLLVWMQTKDGRKGKKRPKSILEALLNPNTEKEDIAVYDSGQAFTDEWNRLTGREV